MTEVIMSIVIPVGFFILGFIQINKMLEVARQKGGTVFVSNKLRVILCALLTIILLGFTYYVIWCFDFKVALAPMGLAMIPFMMGVSSYCAFSDTHVFITQAMKIGAVSFTKTVDKGSTVQLYFRYNGQDFGHSFSKESYEFIKEVRARQKEMRTK